MTNIQLEQRPVIEAAYVLSGAVPGQSEGLLQMAGVSRDISGWIDGRWSPSWSLFLDWLLPIQP